MNLNQHRLCACYFAITESFCFLAACAETRARECFVPPGALRGKIPEGKSEADAALRPLRRGHSVPLRRARHFPHFVAASQTVWGQSVWGPEILPKPFRCASGARAVCARGRGRLRGDATRLTACAQRVRPRSAQNVQKAHTSRTTDELKGSVLTPQSKYHLFE